MADGATEREAEQRRVPDQPAWGIGWMISSTLILMGVHAGVKYLVVDMPVAQVVWARFAFHLVIALIILAPHLKELFKSENPGLQLFRSGLMALAAFAYFAGLKVVPLADAVAIMFLGPILVAGMAAPLLGEKVGLRRWLGVLCGFIGALIIVRPGGELFGWGVLLIFLAATGNAAYQLATRRLGAADNPATTLLYTPLVGTLAASFFLPFEFEAPDAKGWVIMVGIGAVACLGHFAIIKAYQLAEAAVAAPFAYLQLVWALIIGLILFGDWPDLWTFVGAAVIVASGLYIAHRERRAKRLREAAS